MTYRSLLTILLFANFLLPSDFPAVIAQTPAAREMSDEPEVARQLMQLPEGFEAQLVASEPAVVNPLQINFDARGRLFVLCAALSANFAGTGAK